MALIVESVTYTVAGVEIDLYLYVTQFMDEVWLVKAMYEGDFGDLLPVELHLQQPFVGEDARERAIEFASDFVDFMGKHYEVKVSSKE